MIATPAIHIWTDASWNPDRGGHYAAIIGTGLGEVKIGGVLAEFCDDGNHAEVLAWLTAIVAAAELYPDALAFRVHTDASSCITWHTRWVHGQVTQPSEHTDWKRLGRKSAKPDFTGGARPPRRIVELFEELHEFLGLRQLHLSFRSSQDFGDARVIWCDRVAFYLNCHQIDHETNLDRFARPRPKKRANLQPG